MSGRMLSVLIPSRNEQFLRHTIDDILVHSEADTEVIAICDGSLPLEPINDHPRVKVVLLPKSIGQRAATNLAARMSRAKYIMKCDAHVSFEQGFDVKLMADCDYDWTVVAKMYNLHVFDWQCKACGHRDYMGPLPKQCLACGKNQGFEQVLVWQPRWNKLTTSWGFDTNLHFQYFREYSKRLRRKRDKSELTDTMSLIGACWFLHRDRYWELGGLDERHTSWGQMGTEIACMTWLTGGRLVCNQKTWFAHMFRTREGFSFPYPMDGRAQQRAKEHSRWLWTGGNYPKMIRPLSSLVEQFMPVLDWTPEAIDDLKKTESKKWPVTMSKPKIEAPAIVKSEPSKGIVFYTDCLLPDPIAEAVHHQLRRCVNGHQVIAVSLGKAIDLGVENIIVERERSVLTLYYQILAGLERSKADIIYMAEHDVLYNQSHYEFVPPRKDAYFYNTNLWRVDAITGKTLFYVTQSQSQLVAYRDTLLTHYRKRIERIENQGHYSRSIGHEPGLRPLPKGIDNLPALNFSSAYPNIDIRHGGNLTKSRWNKRQFRDKTTCSGWTESDGVPAWGKTAGRFDTFLEEVTRKDFFK